MSFIPNTTPTPNWLYNGEMKKMSDVELRVVLLVTRHTLGWIENQDTGMRKQEDWISHSQLVTQSGRSSRSISSAVENCVKNGWIETRDKDGNILLTSNERRRRRVFYRLGNIFTDKLKSTANSSVDENLPQIMTKSTAKFADNLPQILRYTKETHTKETIQSSALEEVVFFWNSKQKGNPDNIYKNTTAYSRLLPKCRIINNEIKTAFKKIEKEYSQDDVILGIKNYLRDIVSRNPENDFAIHRFSFYEFIKQENGFRKFINK